MFLGSYVIVAVTVVFLLGVGVTYLVSMSAGHVEPVWCFISYTGNLPIESCIFSFVLNLCSAMYLLIVILRYCQIVNVFEKVNSLSQNKIPKKMQVINVMSLVVGLMGATGLSAAGSFQQRNVHCIHMIGVFCCTCGTNTYLLFQTYFSYTVMSSHTKTYTKVFRILIVLTSSTTLIAGSVLAVWFFVDNPHRLFLVRSVFEDEVSALYKAGSVLEWFLFFATLVYFLSFYPDFTKIVLKRDKIIFMN